MSFIPVLKALGRGIGSVLTPQEEAALARTPPFMPESGVGSIYAPTTIPSSTDETDVEYSGLPDQIGMIPPTLPPARKPSRAAMIGKLLQGGIDAASTPNVAHGGPTDIFRGMSNAGQMARQRELQDYTVARQKAADMFARSKDQREWKRINEIEQHNRNMEKGNADRLKQQEAKAADQELTEALKDRTLKVLGEGESAPEGRATHKIGRHTVYKLSPEEILADEIETGKRVPVSIPEGQQQFYGGRKTLFVPVNEADAWGKFLQSSKDNAPKALEQMKQAYFAEIDSIADPEKNATENKRLRSAVEAWFTAGKPDRAAMAIDMAGRRLSGQDYGTSPAKIAATAAAAAAGATGRINAQMQGLGPNAVSPEAADRLNALVDNIRQDKYISVYKQAKPLFQSIEKSVKAGNGVGDLAMLRNFARLLDPNTGVREEEYRSMQGAMGAIQRAGVTVTKGWWNGEQLTQTGREAFLRMSKDLFDGYEQNRAEAEKLYRIQANALGIDPNMLFGNKAQQGQPELAKPNPTKRFNPQTGRLEDIR